MKKTDRADLLFKIMKAQKSYQETWDMYVMRQIEALEKRVAELEAPSVVKETWIVGKTCKENKPSGEHCYPSYGAKRCVYCDEVAIPAPKRRRKHV